MHAQVEIKRTLRSEGVDGKELLMLSRPFRLTATLAVFLALSASIVAPAADDVDSPASRDRAPAWTGGPPTAADYFPIAVWLQDPRNAGRYKAIGINLYVGLWRGPTARQLEELERHGMAVICSQNDLRISW